MKLQLNRNIDKKLSVLYRLFLVTFALLIFFGCEYISFLTDQTQYKHTQKTSPSERNLRRMTDSINNFVFGKVVEDISDLTPDTVSNKSNLKNRNTITVIAVSNRFKENEIVDMYRLAAKNGFYALYLPDGDYNILAVEDKNRDYLYEPNEIISSKSVSLPKKNTTKRVLSDFNIVIGEKEINQGFRFKISIPRDDNVKLGNRSIFPKGSVRSLDDEIFSKNVVTLGIYSPIGFLSKAENMFYSLEEFSNKVPVVLVHGYGGSVRDFQSIIAMLDRNRYMPWFFYYPTGSDLNLMANMFYDIFLSGKFAKSSTQPMVIVAHSMGGIVVREAINLLNEKGYKNTYLRKIITIASPLGGHPSAQDGIKNAPLPIPSWINIAPNSKYIKNLYRTSMPKAITYCLITAYGNPEKFKFGENSDGNVPLSSQLRFEAQSEATKQLGLNVSHTSILEDSEAVKKIVQLIHEVKK